VHFHLKKHTYSVAPTPFLPLTDLLFLPSVVLEAK